MSLKKSRWSWLNFTIITTTTIIIIVATTIIIIIITTTTIATTISEIVRRLREPARLPGFVTSVSRLGLFGSGPFVRQYPS